jgi:5'-methylthioadenosine phosphorylase
MSKLPPLVAIIGGSGLYRLFDPAESEARSVQTPYGAVSVTIGALGGRDVAFLPRHGADHSVPPHLINYRANVWALASLGVRVILSSSAVGGLRADYAPGTLVLPDQYIDRTWGRADTFFDRGSVQHLASADPFEPRLHALALDALRAAGETVAPTGTVVVIQGPRFSTRAESRWFAAAGGDIVNMTMYPEVSLASELNIATVNLSFVTDSDAGAEDAAAEATGQTGNEVSHGLVLERLAAAQPRIIAALETLVRSLPADFSAGTMPPDAVAEILARRATP